MWGRQAHTTVRIVGVWLAFSLVAVHLASAEQARRAGDAVPVLRSAPIAHAAFETAAATGERMQIPGEGDEHTLRFANPDGTVTTELSSVPVRVRDEDGAWEPVDYTLERVGDRVAPIAGDQEVSFSGGGTASMVEFVNGSEDLALDWFQTLPTPDLSGPTATYREVLPGVDLLLTAVPGGYTEILRVRSSAAAANPALDELRFPLDLSEGAQAVNRATGGFDVVDDAGKPVFLAGEPRMWDSSGREASPANGSVGAADAGIEEGDQLAAIDVTATNSQVAVVPNQTLLQGADTIYPVFIDPHTITPPRMEWTMVQKEQPTTEAYEWANSDWGNRGQSVGYQNDQGVSTKRLIWEFDISGIFSNATVIDSYFRVHETHSWSCTKAPVYLDRVGLIGPGTNWSNQPAKLNAGHLASADIQVRTPDGGPNDCKGEVTPVRFTGPALDSEIQKLVDGDRLALRLSSDESSTLGWKRFWNDALLSVTQNRTPWKPNALGLQYGGGRTCHQDPDLAGVVAASATALPWLRGEITDPDGDKVDALFDLYRYNRATSQWDFKAAPTVLDNASGGTVLLPLKREWVDTDAGVVLGGQYRFTMQGRDPWQYGPVTNSCHFFLDTDDPKLAVRVAINDGPNGALRALDEDDQEEWLEKGKTLSFRFDPAGSIGPRGGNDVDKYLISSDVTALNNLGYVDPIALGALGSLHVETSDAPGEHWLKVKAVDESGRVSDERLILFRVKSAVQTALYEFDEGSGSSLAAKGTSDGVADPAFTATSGLEFVQQHPAQPDGTPADWVLRMDGTGGATSSKPVVPTTSDAFSVSAWVRADSVSQRRVVVSQTNAGGEVFTLGVEPGCSAVCAVFTVTDPATGTTHSVRSTAPVPVGQWMVLSGSFDDLAVRHRIKVWVGNSTTNRTVTQVEVPNSFSPGASQTGATRLGFELSGGTPANRWLGAIEGVRFHSDEVAYFDVDDHISDDKPNL